MATFGVSSLEASMRTEMGEYVVGAYLRHRLKCDFVGYNIRPPSEGLEGLAELDVVGLKFAVSEAYLCEVTTHLDGLQYGTYETTVKKVKDKVDRQKIYAEKNLQHFKTIHFMLWSPVVRKGVLTDALSEIDGLELVINQEYTRRVQELQEAAKTTTRDTGNPFFRVLQLLAHLRKAPNAA
jgi:hypothetical protein